MKSVTVKQNLIIAYTAGPAAIFGIMQLITIYPRPLWMALGGLGIGICMLLMAAVTLLFLTVKRIEKRHKKIKEKYSPLGTDLNKYFESKTQYKEPRIGS